VESAFPSRGPRRSAAGCTPDGSFKTAVGKCWLPRTTFGAGEEARAAAEEEKEEMKVRRHVALLELCDAASSTRSYFQDPGDGRQQPQIPAGVLLWALLRTNFFGGRVSMPWKPWARSSARVSSGIHGFFGRRHHALFCGAPGYPALAAGAGSGGSPAPSGTKLSILAAGSAGRRRQPVPDGEPVRAGTLCRQNTIEKQILVITSFGDDQCGGHRTDFNLAMWNLTGPAQ